MVTIRTLYRFHCVRQAIRPRRFLETVAATLVVSYATAGHLGADQVLAAVCMGWEFLGASLTHRGFAFEMYNRKPEELGFRITRPMLMAGCGIGCFVIALMTARHHLPIIFHDLLGLDAIIIGLYAPVLCKHPYLKNLPIAVVCSSPVIIGVLSAEASPFEGRKLLFTITALVGFLAREIMKDIDDLCVDKEVGNLFTDGGSRFTLPMLYGVLPTMRIVGTLSALGGVLALFLSITDGLRHLFALPLFVLGIGLFSLTAHQLLTRAHVQGNEQHRLMNALVCLMIGLFVGTATT